MPRRGPGVITGGEDNYFHWRMALIRGERDNTKAMRMLADLARWNAMRLRPRAYTPPMRTNAIAGPQTYTPRGVR